MLLIFPSIEISDGCCLQSVRGDGTNHLYPNDPIKTAILWRGENAKTLHVIDVDGVREGKVVNRATIAEMVKAVDIPVQVAGGLQDYEEICDLIELGVYRVVIGTAAIENPSVIERVIRKFGARKVAISIETYNGTIRTRRGTSPITLTPLQHTLALKRLGVCRIIYASIDEATGKKILRLDELRNLASRADIRVTAQGGVQNYADLLELQKLEQVGVDSVIIGKSLYENRFPCQELWRLNERGLTDLGPTRRM
ncbi:MAG: 1-(5-phosphoribosyl)-5-((5-phosphoribosylamino)methylideneamino)imidazole-4-carboxamide isomerase [Ignavibacteria bacterium]|nr:1-(5-phosphoribosyl)-5-((5-phosphoribosylamino)methylideneamino)imidazole-4-carboxamide isomerase [Ignavibacteria bacterium]